MAGQTRSLRLPHGGTIEVPLPGAGGQMKMRAPSLADAATCPHLAGTVIICLIVGGVLGAAAAAFWVGRK